MGQSIHSEAIFIELADFLAGGRGPGAITVEICPFPLLRESNDYLG